MHPPTINDSVFGELKFDPADYLRWYQGVAQLAPDHEVEILIYTEGGEPFNILERARAAYAVIQHRESGYPPEAAKELLEAYNENWNDGTPLDGETFASRIGLYRFSFHPDGKVELDYDDDDMFLGHSIAVRLDENLDVSEVGIEG
jgi:hypothetical protein